MRSMANRRALIVVRRCAVMSPGRLLIRSRGENRVWTTSATVCAPASLHYRRRLDADGVTATTVRLDGPRSPPSKY